MARWTPTVAAAGAIFTSRRTWATCLPSIKTLGNIRDQYLEDMRGHAPKFTAGPMATIAGRAAAQQAAQQQAAQQPAKPDASKMTTQEKMAYALAQQGK
jgi:hypothetical protein